MYNIKYTDITKTDIDINEGEVDNSTDLTLFGRIKLEYGQQLNENLLHLLENFAAPETIGSTFINAIPDFNNATYNNILLKPVNGQLWFNTSRKKFYFWDGTVWFPITNGGDYAANWGTISDGFSLPKPVSATTGYVFDYSECSWIVSPYQFPGVLDYLLCNSNSNAQVTSIYSVDGDDTIYEGFATYLIVGIKDNVNLGSVIANPTPTPTPSVTPSAPSLTDPATPTPTTTPTPTPTPTPAYIGDLKAIVYNASSYNDAFNGDVDAWFPGDYKEISKMN